MKHIKLFEQFKNQKKDELVVLSNLLKEIKDKSLQMIIRRVIFSDENIKDVVMEERPGMSEADFEKLAK